MRGGPGEPAGYYRLVDPAGGAGLFAKVLPDAFVARHAAADRLAFELARAGVRVVASLPGFPVPLDAGHTVFVYPYVAARFARAEADELFQVGAGIAALHVAMARLAGRDAIRDAAQERFTRLFARAEAIRNTEVPAGSHLGRLRALLADEALLLELLRDWPGSQPVHGDLVYANVLVPLEGGTPIVIDFEDAAFSWLPPVFDVAQAIERFALEASNDEEQAWSLATALVAGYRSVAGVTRWEKGFRPVLQTLALRALLVLADVEATGTHVEAAEWRKFFALHDRASARSGMLQNLDRFAFN